MSKNVCINKLNDIVDKTIKMKPVNIKLSTYIDFDKKRRS